MAKLITLLLTISMLVVIGCSDDDDDDEMGQSTAPSPTATANATYQDVSASEAKNLIDSTPNLVILDVSPLYDRGHIPGAINHPMSGGSLEAAIPSLDNAVPYLVYCHSDSVSIAASELLVAEGFGTVYRLEGNFTAWVDAGFDVETAADASP